MKSLLESILNNTGVSSSNLEHSTVANSIYQLYSKTITKHEMNSKISKVTPW